MQAAQPQYNIPSRPYFSETVIPRIYERVHEKILYQISLMKNISFTTDMWTSVNNESYISLTAHFIDDNFSLKQALLNVKYFEGKLERIHCISHNSTNF